MEEMYIFMCVWKRLHNLDKLLTNINSQTCASQIVLNIWNNNKDTIEEVNKIINDRTDLIYKINIHHSEKNYYAFGRFIHIKMTSATPVNSQQVVPVNSQHIVYAIIIDDDQLFFNDYFQKLWNMKKEKTLVTWYGAIPYKKNYWNRKLINLTELLKNKKPYVKEFVCGGPGFAVIDTSIVNNNEFINCDEKYYVADDIFLSYIIKKNGWKIKRSFLPPILLQEENDISEEMHLTVANHKHEIYDELFG